MFHSPRHSKSHQGTQTDSDLIFSDSAKTLNQSTVIREEFYEEQSLLYDRLLKSEEVRNTTFNFIFSIFNKIQHLVKYKISVFLDFYYKIF